MNDLSKQLAHSLLEQATALFYQHAGHPEWVKQIQNDELHQVLKLAEAQLSGSPSAVDIKLFWVFCQLEEGSVPISALTSSLEELREKFSGSKALGATAASIFLRVAIKLIERSQLRLAVTMFERALELGEASNAFSDKLSRELRELYKLTLSDELDAALRRREKKPYLTSLEERRAAVELELEKTKKVTVKAPEPETSPVAKKRVLNAKSIIEANQLEEANNDSSAAAVTASTGEKAAAKPVPKPLKSGLGLSRAVLYSAILFGIFIIGGTYGWLFVFPKNSTEDNQTLAAKQTPTATETTVETLTPTTLAPVETQDSQLDTAKLDALAERLDKLSIKGEGVTEEPSASETPSAPEAAQDTTGETSPQNTAGETSAQEEIKENNEAKLLAKQAPLPPQESTDKNVPDVDPTRYSPENIKDLGDSGTTAPPPRRGFHLGPDGRLYGPPRAAGSSGKGLDGKPVGSFQVEQFQQALLFKTIAPTEVFSAPSLLSKTVAKLGAGTRLHVMSRMGGWLEVESKRGERGYVYAQDAVELGVAPP